MFGHDDSNQAVMGSTTVQNPSMLDNVTQQDFQSPDPAQSATTPTTTTAAQPTQEPRTASEPSEVTTSEHQITTDNPFVQNPIGQPSDEPPEQTMPAVEEPTTTSSSGPVDPPVVVPDDDTAQDQSSYLAALSDDDSSSSSSATSTPVDQDKLADMKQQALAHLEPLTEHIDGTPEERFKTTMMMIQANDNHTLLDKALDAAKEISDDKERAQAMLDIINEINYFSQNDTTSNPAN